MDILYMGEYLGKGSCWQFLHKPDSRETSLLNAANHFKIFPIEFEICLYEHLYFLYIRNPLFPIVAFISMFWQPVICYAPGGNFKEKWIYFQPQISFAPFLGRKGIIYHVTAYDPEIEENVRKL